MVKDVSGWSTINSHVSKDRRRRSGDSDSPTPTVRGDKQPREMWGGAQGTLGPACETDKPASPELMVSASWQDDA